MEYTVVLTRENSHWRAVATDLPECAVDAPTRDEAITMIKSRIADVSQYVEILKIEIPECSGIEQPLNVSKLNKTGSIWDYYGVFKDDPTLDEMFDEIERKRDQRLAGE